MKRIIAAAILAGAGWWYFNQPEPEPEDRVSKIISWDHRTQSEKVVWERK